MENPMMEVPIVCPKCERRTVGYIAQGCKLKIRHSGLYELTCNGCVKPLAEIIGAMTKKGSK